MALYDAFEGLNVDATMAQDAAIEIVQECLSPCVLSRFDGEIISVNSAWTALCGYEQSEAQGKNFSLLQGHATDKQKAKSFVYALHVNKEADVALVNYRKDAKPFHHVISSRLLASDHGDGFYLTQSREEYPHEQVERLRLEGAAIDETSTGKRRFSAAELTLMAVCMLLTILQLLPGLATRLMLSGPSCLLFGSGWSGGEGEAVSVNLLDERDFTAALRFVRGVSTWSSP